MSFFGKIWDWLIGLLWKKEMSITIIGLSNAGKSTLIQSLMGSKDQETVPTIGVQCNSFVKGSVEIKAWDIGGSSQFQFLWPTYCHNANAILYVCDAADENAIEQSANQLHDLFSNNTIFCNFTKTKMKNFHY